VLRPQDTATRERKSLSGLWLFALNPAGDGRIVLHRCSTASTPLSASRGGTSKDFATTSGIMRLSGNNKGAFTRDRHPKAAAHALRRRWRKDA
jgi:beta-galactosidase/beta-glucuronidase